MICLVNAAPVADPAGASELYSIVDGLEEQLCCGAISAAVAAAMLIEECPADLKEYQVAHPVERSHCGFAPLLSA